MLGELIPWAILIGGLIVAFLTTWFGGERSGKTKAKLDASERNLDAAKRAKDTRHEIETDDDQRIIDILTGKLHNKR